MVLFALLILSFFCALLSVPLVFFATNYQSIFSFLVCVAVFAIFGILIFKSVRKQGIKKFGIDFIKFLIFATALFISFILVLKGLRLLSLGVISLAILIFLFSPKLEKILIRAEKSRCVL